MSDDRKLTPEQIIEAWIDADIPLSDLPARMTLTPAQAFRMRRAAIKASLQAYHRILAGRRLHALMRFGRTTDDLTETVEKAWAAGEMSAKAAGELIGTDAAGLLGFADRFGVEVTRGDG